MRRLSYTLVILGSLLASPAAAATLSAQLLPLSGEVRLQNSALVPVPFVFYSVKSPGGALNGSSVAWNSISDHYDVNGDGSVDSRGQWIKISSSAVELAEGVLLGPGGTLAAQQTISLGPIWKPGVTPFPDLAINVIQLDGQPANVITVLALDGDFNHNGSVDTDDYVQWRNTLNTSVPAYSGADANGDGVVSSSDYSIWAANFGAVLRPDGGVGFAASSAAQSGGAVAGVVAFSVPEPSSCTLFLMGAMVCLRLLRRRRRC